MPRCSCAETKPGCRLKNSASAAHALIRCSASSGLTLNLLTRMTGPSLVANCADSGNVSSISTNFIISSFLSQLISYRFELLGQRAEPQMSQSNRRHGDCLLGGDAHLRHAARDDRC